MQFVYDTYKGGSCVNNADSLNQSALIKCDINRDKKVDKTDSDLEKALFGWK